LDKHLLIGQKVIIIAEKPLLAIQEVVSEVQSISKQLETTKYVDKKGHLRHLYDKNPMMWKW